LPPFFGKTATMSLLFTPLELSSPRGSLKLSNRIVVAPMCQYSAENGEAGDWHLMHWGNLLNSGAGLFIIEATAISPEARITPRCLGLWDDRTHAALADKLTRARALAPSVPIIIQLAHAGRKSSSAVPWDGGQLLELEKGGWHTKGPSCVPHLEGERDPQELTADELQKVLHDFVEAAKRAEAIGIDGIELHGAHGYLLHQFLSPISNHRDDHYGGSSENRMRFVLEVFSAVRKVFSGVLGIRLSASDWIDGGWTAEESIELAKKLKASGADFIHVSSGGISPKQQIKIGPNYQVHFSKKIKAASGLTTIAVGLITDPHQAEAILQEGDADLIGMARAFLFRPRWGWEAAAVLQGQVTASAQYWRCLPKEAQSVFGQVKLGQR
jgi:2,4-dienoyl-CoA reductase-like NADH-dependent reductase (Old Yellow Enzyme family)